MRDRELEHEFWARLTLEMKFYGAETVGELPEEVYTWYLSVGKDIGLIEED